MDKINFIPNSYKELRRKKSGNTIEIGIPYFNRDICKIYNISKEVLDIYVKTNNKIILNTYGLKCLSAYNFANCNQNQYAITNLLEIEVNND